MLIDTDTVVESGGIGFCLNCGFEQDCEPDARGYECGEYLVPKRS